VYLYRVGITINMHTKEIENTDTQPASSTQEVQQLTEELKEYKNELAATINKCQDSFEKQLSYISAGCLALSIGFIKNIIAFDTAQHRSALTVGWGFLGGTLLINLSSHLIAARLHYCTFKEINEGKYDYGKTLNRIWWVNTLNWASMLTLILGIGLIIYFVTINL
jgi:hypothetical protein